MEGKGMHFLQETGQNFHSSCEGGEPGAMWACLGCYSTLPHITARGGNKGFSIPGRRAWLGQEKSEQEGETLSWGPQ